MTHSALITVATILVTQLTMTNRHRKSKHVKVTQKLKIELQSLISYACYDHDDVLLAGKSMTQPEIQNRMYKLYMPPIKGKGKERLSIVEMFLTGKGRFEPLFKCVETIDNLPSGNYTKLVIPELLHNIPDQVFTVGKQVTAQMLTT